MTRLLLLLPTTTYRAHDLLAAGRKLAVDITVASDRRQALEPQTDGSTLTLDFADRASACRVVRREHERSPFAAVIGADDETTVLASAVAADLALPHNPVRAVERAGDKLRFRRALRSAGLAHPGFLALDSHRPDLEALETLGYPCVLKPTFLSASRGVIRVDDREQARTALARIAAILAEPAVRRRGGKRAGVILAERYLPGGELSVEAILRDGALHPLVLFDKPDPLEGPFFEETIFVSPSSLGPAAQQAVIEGVRDAIAAIGLREGPVHAEVRLTPGGPVVLEVAPRAIGGLCSRALAFGAGISLEEVLLRHALGESIEAFLPQRSATGVMMIPIPGAGRLGAVRGLGRARECDAVVEVTLTMHRGDELVPLPEGNRYLGFIFARAEQPQDVEAALRRAHACIEIDVERR